MLTTLPPSSCTIRRSKKGRFFFQFYIWFQNNSKSGKERGDKEIHIDNSFFFSAFLWSLAWWSIMNEWMNAWCMGINEEMTAMAPKLLMTGFLVWCAQASPLTLLPSEPSSLPYLYMASIVRMGNFHMAVSPQPPPPPPAPFPQSHWPNAISASASPVLVEMSLWARTAMNVPLKELLYYSLGLATLQIYM